MCASVNNFLGFYHFIFSLVSSAGRIGGKEFSLQFNLISRIYELTQVSFSSEQDVTSADFHRQLL